MILLIISLAGFIVVDLTHTSYLDIRSNLISERSLRAEYYLKSAVNFGRGLLILDTNTASDGQNEPWAPFALQATRLPLEELGIDTHGLIVDMVILPLNISIPVHELAENISGQREQIRDVLLRLIQRIFENSPNQLNDDPDPQFDDRVFSPTDMVANLIDYMDKDDPSAPRRSYDHIGTYTYEGIEDEFPEDYFPNRPMSNLKELSNVPGWTDSRISALSPYLYTYSAGATSGGATGRASPGIKMNINFMKEQIITALEDGLDRSAFESIESRRTDQGQDVLADSNIYNELNSILGDQAHHILTGKSDYFVIKARVRYGDTSTIMSTTVYRDSGSGPGAYPVIVSQEIY